MNIIDNLPSMKGTLLNPLSRLDDGWSVLKNVTDASLILTEGPSSAALAFKVWPQAKTNISLIVYAGGTLLRGDATPFAEKSVYADPYGMESLLNTGIPVVFCTIEAAAKRGMTPEEMAYDYVNHPEKYNPVFCGVHTEIQKGSIAFGKLIPDYLADHKFEKKNAYIIVD